MNKKLILVFIVIGSLQVFNLTFLGSLVRLFHLAAIGIMVVLILLDLIYFKTLKIKQNFALPIYLLFAAMVLSMFSAYYSYNQNFALSAYAQRDIYFYLLYFVLHILKIDKKSMQRLIILFGIVYLVAYLIQFVAFPTRVFDVLMREDRNTIRVYLQGSGYSLLGYFMCLYVFFATNKLKYLVLALILFIPSLLFGSRSVLMLTVLATIVQLLFSRRIQSKPLIVALVLLALIPAYYFSQGIIEGMQMASEADTSKGTDYVRIRAAQFYLTQFMPTDLSILTGVGAPTERSPLGQLTADISSRYHFNLSDIGIVSNFVTYGIFFVIGIFWLSIKAMTIRIRPDLQYLKYFMFFLVILMLPIAAGFASSPSIAVICCMFYLLDISNMEHKTDGAI